MHSGVPVCEDHDGRGLIPAGGMARVKLAECAAFVVLMVPTHMRHVLRVSRATRAHRVRRHRWLSGRHAEAWPLASIANCRHRQQRSFRGALQPETGMACHHGRSLSARNGSTMQPLVPCSAIAISLFDLFEAGPGPSSSPEEVRVKYPRESENPFDSDRKMMATKHSLNGVPTMIVKGAVDVLLDRTDWIEMKGETYEITEETRRVIEEQNQKYSREGLRVLAFAYKEVSDETELTLEDEDHLIFLGLIAMMDPPREESKAAVEECKCAGIRPIMITGDHKVTAAAIAKRIGILENESEACEGAEIDKMSDEELKDFVEGISVYARVSPEHKIRIVRAWQEKGNIVSMTGDGVNDAPALKQADIGVAMGITGSEVSKDAAAMVLTDDNFATIIKAVENGRNVYRNIKASIQFLLSGNFGAILAVLYASLMALPVPFAPVHLLFINLLTDSLPAIALGLEPHSKNVMKEKPRPINESILTKDFLINIGLEGLSICTMVMIAFTIGYKDGNALLASTMAFATLCCSRLFHGFNCKSNRPVVFTKRVFNNIYLIGAFVIGMILITLVVTVPGLHNIFKVQTLILSQLLTVYGLAALNLPIIQTIKAIRAKLEK